MGIEVRLKRDEKKTVKALPHTDKGKVSRLAKATFGQSQDVTLQLYATFNGCKNILTVIGFPESVTSVKLFIKYLGRCGKLKKKCKNLEVIDGIMQTTFNTPGITSDWITLTLEF